ncbi:hypothetical protein BaRGS_00028273 [Batillaria attramentaria]|uniref:Uncharacterized protein n=1 Tax=Batillaria attramentaria TaxID=370345 RepID=A0ABD0JZE3_9CAEN
MNDAELQMMHLDNQLKAAFKLISSNDVKKEPEAPPRSRPDVCARSDENTRPVKRHTDSKMKFFASDQ